MESKKIVSFLIVVFTNYFGFSQTFTDGNNFTYEVSSTTLNTVTLTSGNNASGAIVVPETVDFESVTYTVTRIGGSAFRDNPITEITLPNTIESIGGSAIRNTNLTSITIPDSVKIIQNSGIAVNNSLTTVIIGSGLETVESNGFRANSVLSSVTSNNPNAPSLGFNVFLETPSNKTLTIPEPSLSSYQDEGWAGNFSLVNGLVLVFTESDGFTYRITSVNPNQAALINGNNATGAVTVPETVVSESITYRVTRIEQRAFENNPITEINLPNTIESIGGSAIRNTNLTSIVIPNSVKIIENSGISVNSGLTSVQIGLGLETIESNGFRGNSILNSVTISAFIAPSLGANVFTNTPVNKSLTIPEGSKNSYEAAGWITNFFLINGKVSIGSSFSLNNLTYTITSLNPNEVSLTDANNVSGEVNISNEVSVRDVNFNVTALGENAFRDNDLTSITIPSSVMSVGNNAFTNNLNLTKVTSNNPLAPTLGGNVFSNTSTTKELIIPNGSGFSYADAGWNAFFSAINGILLDQTFIVDGITFKVFSVSPNEVQVTGANSSITDLVIPPSITDNNIDFKVVSIANSAFDGAGLTSVIFPNTLRDLGDVAFRSNLLTEVVIPNGIKQIPQRCFFSNSLTSVTFPDSLEDIKFRAFERNDLTEITLPRKLKSIEPLAFGTNPITKITSLNELAPSAVIGEDRPSFSNVVNIDLFIPTNSTPSYENAGWVGFKSINEILGKISVALKVFLQGAFSNPNVGEENLMRDDLRVAGIISSISPYSSETIPEKQDTIPSTNTIGQNALVDWVLVQLLDANDKNIIIASKSALLQRDGDIVGTDGVSNLNFEVNAGDYFIAIKHRNHLRIMTQNTMNLNFSDITTLDFTSDANILQGGQNAVVSISNGKLAMVSGDVNENGNIQISDLSILVPELGKSGYSIFDLNMNGQIQINDINGLLTPNLGRGEQ
jgi:hypothetical protein